MIMILSGLLSDPQIGIYFWPASFFCADYRIGGTAACQHLVLRRGPRFLYFGAS
jgi:hypothetical protein